MGHRAVDVGPSTEQLIEVSGLGLGAASERFVQVATAHGFTVVATGPNRFRLARTYRPKWALIAAVATAVFVGLGLLFLLVKRTETGDVVVLEERSGVKVRVTGSLQEPMIDALRQALSAVVGAAVAPTTAAAFQGPATAPTSPVGVVAPEHQGHSGSERSAVGPPVLRAPAAAPQAVPTIAPTLVFASGAAINVGVGGVLGRDPSGDPSLPGGQLYPVSDPSLSKTHLSFGPLPHGVWVLDHHSTNGTVVSANGVTVPCTPGVRVEAPFGSQVVAGDVSLVVSSR